MNPGSARSLAEILDWRAMHQADRLAYGFLDDGERPGATLTYGRLGAQAEKLATALRRLGPPGERALLFFPPGLELVEAFWSCLRAGWVAVPAPLASPARLGRGLPRLQAIGRDAGLAAILTSSRFRAAALELAAAIGGEPAEVVAVDELAGNFAAPPLPLDPDEVALLQYTSGSTAQPRAAVVRHRHLLYNLARIDECQRNDEESVSLSWLPLAHDLGLVAGVLHPLYRGCPAWLMAPAAFLLRPLRWLEAIGLLRATNSGGPNFAFDLCVARSREEQREALDLRSWRYAHLGGETVRAGTLAAFARAFAPAGFQSAALQPGYGLAEATLIVTAGLRGDRYRVTELSRRALSSEGRVAPPENEKDTARIVGCGKPIEGTEVKIVASEAGSAGVPPASGRLCPPGKVGEIWVGGPGVVGGYWRNPAGTALTFGARLAGAEENFLRTGDLGFLAGGELFVTGRLKDLIVVRGANHYPQDLELCLERDEPRLKAGGSAAFAVESDGGEAVVLVAEVAPACREALRGEAGSELVLELREKVGREHELPIAAIVLLEPGRLLKTTSGKVRRQACREAFLKGELATLFHWQREPAPADVR
jgi:acyl-CoA synthetase (AMP-forming)/AMP-acid ligase II